MAGKESKSMEAGADMTQMNAAAWAGQVGMLGSDSFADHVALTGILGIVRVRRIPCKIFTVPIRQGSSCDGGWGGGRSQFSDSQVAWVMPLT